jgi:hypothetical protein
MRGRSLLWWWLWWWIVKYRLQDSGTDNGYDGNYDDNGDNDGDDDIQLHRSYFIETWGEDPSYNDNDDGG